MTRSGPPFLRGELVGEFGVPGGMDAESINWGRKDVVGDVREADPSENEELRRDSGEGGGERVGKDVTIFGAG